MFSGERPQETNLSRVRKAKYTHRMVATETTADPNEFLGAGMAPQSCPKLRQGTELVIGPRPMPRWPQLGRGNSLRPLRVSREGLTCESSAVLVPSGWGRSVLATERGLV